MDNLFLAREIGSIETGPQTFAYTNVVNTTFLFTKEFTILPEDPAGLLNSVLVQNAGRTILNGTFNYVTLFEEKPYYNKDGDPNYFIIFFENQWQIYDYSVSFEPVYFSNENVRYPWHVINWSAANSIYNPVPLVTKVI
jgi:hypothetical protein